jgi:hypothetical protein
MEHFGQKAAELRSLREAYGRTGSFDLAVAPPFRPREPTSQNALRFLEEVHELQQRGATWIWTSLPGTTLESYLEIVNWFGEEVVAAHAAHSSS